MAARGVYESRTHFYLSRFAGRVLIVKGFVAKYIITCSWLWREGLEIFCPKKLYFVSQIICVLPYVISKYISVPPSIFPYHNERYLWNKDNCTNLDKSMKRRMTFAFEVLCWCTLSPPPAQKSRHQKPRKSHESDQRAQIGRPCIPDLFSLNSFNQNCYFLAVLDSSIGDLVTHSLTQWVTRFDFRALQRAQ